MASEAPDAPFSAHEALVSYMSTAVRAYWHLRNQLLPVGDRIQPSGIDPRAPTPEPSPAGWQTEQLRALRPLPNNLEPTVERLEMLRAFAVVHNQAVQHMLIAIAPFYGQTAIPSDFREHFIPDNLRMSALLNRLKTKDLSICDTVLAVLQTAELVAQTSRKPDTENLTGQIQAIDVAIRNYPDRTRYHTAKSDAVLYAAAQKQAAVEQDVHALRRMMNLEKTAGADISKPLPGKDDRAPRR
jgi:hypothetical protein